MQVRNSKEGNKLNQYYRNNIENAAKTKHKNRKMTRTIWKYIWEFHQQFQLLRDV